MGYETVFGSLNKSTQSIMDFVVDDKDDTGITCRRITYIICIFVVVRKPMILR